MVQDAVVDDVPLVYEVSFWYWNGGFDSSPVNPKWWNRFLESMSGDPIVEIPKIINDSFGSISQLPTENSTLKRFEIRFNDHAALTLFILQYT